MRMMPSRYVRPVPTKVKKVVAQVSHVSPPLKGLNLSSKLTTGDPLTAPILTNFVVEDDRIRVRPGTKKLATMAGATMIETLVPFYGPAPKLLAGTNNTLCDAQTGAVVRGGFTGNDWSWTSFANLGQTKYTLMCNGRDGVWSWDGTLASGVDPGPIVVTSLSNTNPAKCTVAVADMGKFQNGMSVVIAGATGTGMTAANGAHVIGNVLGATFDLVGVDTSTGAAPQTTGVTADPPAASAIFKETVTAPTSEPWINPNQFQIVLSHMNRVWFADGTNLAVYYLPLQTKSGEVKVLPLNALFKRGGSIRAVYTWTMEGGVGINDQLVIFSTNGECVIYAGTDPDTDFELVGIYRFDSPMSKHSVVQYGGELYVLISTGLVPMSTLMRAESEQLGQYDKAVISFFQSEAIKYRTRPGWQAIINPSTSRCIVNVPQGYANGYTQMVRLMPRPLWAQYSGLPARHWCWIDPIMYFGDDSGNVFQMHPQHLSDDGNPITVDVQMSWSLFKTPGVKHFKMLRVYVETDAHLQLALDVKVDYDLSPPENVPDVSPAQPGSEWDLATWDEDYWALGERPITLWNGVAALGRVGAPRLTAQILNAEFSITGFDVIYEAGAVV